MQEKTVNRIIETTRTHGCTFYTVAFAAMVLATIYVNPPDPDTQNLSVPVIFTPVNLRYKNIITRNEDVLSALGYNVLVAGDLSRFTGGSPRDATSAIWILAREVRTQMDKQTDQLQQIGIWAHEFIAKLMEPRIRGTHTEQR